MLRRSVGVGEAVGRKRHAVESGYWSQRPFNWTALIGYRACSNDRASSVQQDYHIRPAGAAIVRGRQHPPGIGRRYREHRRVFIGAALSGTEPKSVGQ